MNYDVDKGNLDNYSITETILRVNRGKLENIAFS